MDGLTWLVVRPQRIDFVEAEIKALRARVEELQAAVKSLQVQQQPIGVGIAERPVWAGPAQAEYFRTADLPKWEPYIHIGERSGDNHGQ